VKGRILGGGNMKLVVNQDVLFNGYISKKNVFVELN